MKRSLFLKVRLYLLGTLAVTIIRFLWLTARIFSPDKKVIKDIRDQDRFPLYASWHGRQFFSYLVLRGQKLVTPASLSNDGEILNIAIGKMGHTIVRGSSSKRAVGMLLEMIREVRKGRGLAVSVDGPRGPYREVKTGIIKVAQKTGNPLVPTVISVNRMWISRKSWDNFMIPKPFCKMRVKYMDPIYVPRKADKHELEQYRQQLQQALEKGYREVDAYFGRPELEDELKNEKKQTRSETG